MEELQRLSIEELAELQVTSVSRRPESLADAPASIFVITGRDIRRSGARSLPEALRLAPNLMVQQVDSRSWSVTARGFSGYETANKLLVLIDGRSIYTTLHSGVFWELHEPRLDDIERIEVVSGPGWTLYGPNAVNGVVNIITRNARDTVGGSARVRFGGAHNSFALRYGDSLGEDDAWRVYVRGFDRAALGTEDGNSARDGWKGVQAGFRADIGSGGDEITLQGDIFHNDYDNVFGVDGDNRGHNLLARWIHPTSDASTLELQAYYDRFERDVLLTHDRLETFDVEAQHNITQGVHEIVWGAGGRITRDAFINNLNEFKLDPVRRRLWMANLFAQDRVTITPTLSATLGLKVERTNFTGIELLPNVRLAWQPRDGALLWLAFSRAVRTPSRIDRDLQATFVIGGQDVQFLAPAKNFRPESLTAVEAGYRRRFGTRGSINVSAYYHRYDDLRTTALSPQGGLPIRLENGMAGRSFGLEAWGNAELAPWWQVSAGINLIDKKFHLKPGRNDLAAMGSTGNDPDSQFSLRSQFNPTSKVDLDLIFRVVDDLPEPRIKGYAELDARLAWRAHPRIELAVSGHNLLHARHLENGHVERAYVRRTIQFEARFGF